MKSKHANEDGPEEVK